MADLNHWSAWYAGGSHPGSRLVASGGLCAPIKPFYRLPERTSLWDDMPSFQATRGGVNIPGAT